jgi:hypothetical protein
MKLRYRKFLWRLAIIMLNRFLKRYKNRFPLAEIEVGEIDWERKRVPIYFTDATRSLVECIPEKILGFTLYGSKVK